MAAKPIVVIGSINMDLVCRTPAMPRPGETILGGRFQTIPGGKGANQAVAAARLAQRGSAVHLIGRVGDDEFGERLLAGLRAKRVNVDHVAITRNVSSGIAVILVDSRGENSIVVAPGANARLTPADVDRARDLIAGASVVVMQLEIPLATVKHAIGLCRKLGVATILDPAPAPARAPARGLPQAFYRVDVLTPNQTEAQALVSTRTKDPQRIASELHGRGVKQVVLKLGGKGSLWADAEGFLEGKPFRVKVVDTTAAGDAFTAALAVARAESMPVAQALRFANAAGALCCMGLGAQPSLPTRLRVDRLVAAGRSGYTL